MAKNYNPWMLLVILLITFNFSYSQSHHTVTFTGNASDFNPNEKISGSNGVDYYVTFNETTMYFGAFNTNPSGSFNPFDHFTIYLDTDPQPITTSGTGSTVGVYWDNKIPSLPFTANHRIVIRPNNSGESFHHKYNVLSNNWETPAHSSIQYATDKALEIAVDLDQIDNPKGLYFSMFFSYGGGGGGFFGYDNPSYPITFNGSDSSGYFGGIGLTTSDCNPTEHVNTPILHTLTNANPTAGGKYAHIEINDGFYSVTGDIVVVAGGTVNIGAGSALTVAGNFTNNGEVSLQSTSTSYSSLIPTSVDGSGLIQYKRHVNRNAPAGQNDLISAPLTGQTFGEFAAANDNIVSHPTIPTIKGFGPFNKSIADYQNYNTAIPADANTVLAPGIGYRAASTIVPPSTSGGTFTFTGTVNTEAIDIPIIDSFNDFAKWNLIGNPYPSYISIREILDNNLTQFDPNYLGIYGYGGANNNDWNVINRVNSAGILMAPGQGFFVLAKDNGGSIAISPNLRRPGNSDDFIPQRSLAADDQASLRLRISNNSTNHSTDIYFDVNGTLDHDLGYDSGLIGHPSLSIFSKLVEDIDNRNLRLLIQTLPYSILDSEVVVPIGITATQGVQLTISGIDTTPQALPLPAAVDVYFEDNVANTSTLLKNSDYIFTPTNNLTGKMGRFTLRFTNKSLSVDEFDFDGLQVFSPQNTGDLIVKGYVNELTSLDVFDLNGRLLQTLSVVPNQAINRFSIPELSSGIYIVKLKNKTQSKVKKIQINR